MRFIIVIILCFLFFPPAKAQSSLLDSSVIDLSGQVRRLDDFSGKKIWILVLPLSHSMRRDSLFMQKLDSICDYYVRRVQVIAVVAYEAGYKDHLRPAMQSWVAAFSRPNLIVTAPMYIRKAAGQQQSGLFKWLTDAHRNGHFDRDAQGAGQSFLVNETGSLYREYDQESGFGWRSITKMLH